MADMRYRPLGDSGLVVSVVGLGCNNFGKRVGLAGTRSVVDAALDVGVTLLDTADIYGDPHGASEELLGEALVGRRDEVVLATKFGMDMAGANGRDFGARASRRYVSQAVEASLRRLRTDHIDLYQLHEPDGVTPVEETLAALDDLVRAGKVRYIGSSNFSAWQVADAEWTARSDGTVRFVSAQNHYNLLEREAEVELVPACGAYGIGVLPFFPLANGLLSGKYQAGRPAPAGSRLSEAAKAYLLSAENLARVEALRRFAEERDRSVLDVAVGGLAARPAVASVIAGARSPEQVRANAAAGGWVPTEDDLSALDAVIADPVGSAS